MVESRVRVPVRASRSSLTRRGAEQERDRSRLVAASPHEGGVEEARGIHPSANGGFSSRSGEEGDIPGLAVRRRPLRQTEDATSNVAPDPDERGGVRRWRAAGRKGRPGVADGQRRLRRMISSRTFRSRRARSRRQNPGYRPRSRTPSRARARSANPGEQRLRTAQVRVRASPGPSHPRNTVEVAGSRRLHAEVVAASILPL